MFADFVAYLTAEKGLSSHTIAAYKTDVTHFLSFIDGKEIGTVTQEDCIAFLSYLKQKEYAPASLFRILMGVKVFFRFLKRERVIEKNVTERLDSPKLWRLLPEVLSLSEMERLLAFPKKDAFKDRRDAAILEVLYACGLRVSELCALTLYDVGDEYVKVKGKGGKERLVPIGKKALACVDAYARFRDLVAPTEEKTLFLTHRGRPIERSCVWRMVKERALEAGIQKKISPHTFRHTFATHLLEGGAELRVIQEMLGHATIQTTDRYTQLNQSFLKEAFVKFHTRN